MSRSGISILIVVLLVVTFLPITPTSADTIILDQTSCLICMSSKTMRQSDGKIKRGFCLLSIPHFGPPVDAVDAVGSTYVV